MTAMTWLHGWAMRAQVWSPLLRSLPGDYQHTLIDLPGHGARPPLAGDIDVWGHAIAQDAVRGVWLGWSLGGLLALWMARQYPERVEKLVLLAATPKFTAARDWPCGVQAAIFNAFEMALRARPQVTLKRFIALQMLAAEPSAPIVQQLQAQLPKQPDSAALAVGLAILRDTDLRVALQDIHCPVLLLLGEQDTLVRAETGAAVLGVNPAVRIVRIPGAGHVPFLSHTTRVADAITQFLE